MLPVRAPKPVRQPPVGAFLPFRRSLQSRPHRAQTHLRKHADEVVVRVPLFLSTTAMSNHDGNDVPGAPSSVSDDTAPTSTPPAVATAPPPALPSLSATTVQQLVTAVADLIQSRGGTGASANPLTAPDPASNLASSSPASGKSRSYTS